MSNKTCLVVDDSRIIRRIARDIVERLDFACGEAEDGAQALDSCRTKMPDVILLDWNMPVMDGYAFLHELRALPEGSAPVVIFCTTENSATQIHRAIAGGANEYIMKPFDADIVRDKFIQTGLLDG